MNRLSSVSKKSGAVQSTVTVVNSSDPSYWTTLPIVFVPAGAFLKYLVWDFFHMPEQLHMRFSTAIAEAHASIHVPPQIS